MKVITKVGLTENKITIPKGTNGIVKAVQWGDKKDGFIVDFPQVASIFITRDNVDVIEEMSIKKQKKELPLPTCGKGSI